jgi:uroporphyrinogen III methyltransferase / synthase
MPCISNMTEFLLLRPEGKCQQSCERFAAAGIPVVGLPLLRIQPLAEQLEQLTEKLLALPAQSKVIFISTSAVKLALQAMEDKSWPSQLSYFAVGNSSAELLRQAGLAVQVPEQQDSEGLLALAELQAVNGLPVLLVKGEGGRELLAQSLTERGAKLTTLSIYRRQRVDKPKPTQPWKPEQIQCIITTSGELMEAAFAQFDHNWLKTLPWILVSDRLMQRATERGITQVIRSADASDDALINTARHFMEQQSMAEPDKISSSKTAQQSAKSQPEKAQNSTAAVTSPSSGSPENNKTENKSALKTSDKGEKPARTGFLWLVVVLNLLLVLMLAAAGYWGWQQFQQVQQAENTELEQALNQSSEQQRQQAEVLEKSVQQLTQQLAENAARQQQALQQRLDEFEQRLSANQQLLQQVKGRRPNDWLLAEAAYLVRMAGRKLWLEHDVQTAILLLESADTRLENLSDPSLLPVRQLLSEDVQQLRQINQQPLTRLALQLGALASQVDALPLDMVVLPDAEEQQVNQELTDSVSDWRVNLKRSWQGIVDDFITVRRRTEQTRPLLSDKQQWLVREQLRLYLLQAQHLVLREQAELYQSFLREAQGLLEMYFAPQAPAVAGFSHSLTELQQADIRRDYPQQLQSAAALDDILGQRLSSQYQDEQP